MHPQGMQIFYASMMILHIEWLRSVLYLFPLLSRLAKLIFLFLLYMRETKFIEQNKEKWAGFEEQLKKGEKDPEKLNSLFMQLTDDLSYARTFYGNRLVRYYLNYLAQKLYLSLYKTKRDRGRKIWAFWKRELPQLVYEARKELTLSFVVFLIAVAIGVFSSRYNPEFPSLILGDSYVQMTRENIAKGDPMAVYQSSSQYDMMFGITLNNIKVAFLTFIFGIALGIGSITFLIYNGVMVGAFQYFFFSKGIITQSILAIWLHGTLEISAIIIAGGAGITLGRGLVFPGTYRRLQSFQMSARRGLKILIGIIPIIVCAAIIESFLTRYTQAHFLLRGGIIFLSLAFVVFYFIVLPFRVARKNAYDSQAKDAFLVADSDEAVNIDVVKTNGGIFKDTFLVFRKYLKKFMLISFCVSLVYSLVVMFLIKHLSIYINTYNSHIFIAQLFDYNSNTLQNSFRGVTIGFLIFMANVLNTFICLSFIYYVLFKEFTSQKIKYFRFLLRKGIGILLFSVLLHALLLLHAGWIFMIALLLLPMFGVMAYAVVVGKQSSLKKISNAFSIPFVSFWKLIGLNLMLLLLCILCFFISNSPILLLYIDIVSWNIPIIKDYNWLITLFFISFSSIFFMNLFLSIYYIGMAVLYYSFYEIKYAKNLFIQIATIGQRKA
jgi:uncharacterized membrane protein SpoIIM required for sporulation